MKNLHPPSDVARLGRDQQELSFFIKKSKSNWRLLEAEIKGVSGHRGQTPILVRGTEQNTSTQNTTQLLLHLALCNELEEKFYSALLFKNFRS